MYGDLTAVGSIQDNVQFIFRDFADRCIQVDAEFFCCSFQSLPIITAFVFGATPFRNSNRTFIQGHIWVLDEQIWIDFQLTAQPLAIGTCSVWGVKGESSRFDFW